MLVKACTVVALQECPNVSDEQVQAVALLDSDRLQMISELGEEIGLSHTIVLDVLKNEVNCIARDAQNLRKCSNGYDKRTLKHT